MTPFAATPTPSPTDLSNLTDSDLGPIPGLLSFVAFVLLAIAVYVIFRSMNKQLKRVDFPEDGPSASTDPGTDESPGARS